MALVSYRNSAKWMARRPYVECYIDGRLRRDCIVELVEQAAGFGASRAHISFPGKRFPHTPAPEGAEVYIYAQRWANPSPVFHGWVRGLNDIYDRPDLVMIRAEDSREGLNDDVSQENYNLVDWDTETVGTGHHARALAGYLHNRYVSWQGAAGNSKYVNLDLSGFYPLEMGQQSYTGNPHGQGIEQLQRLSSKDSRRRTYLRQARYYSGREELSTFRIGSGPVRNITYGTSNLATLENQPFGYPVASRIERVRGDDDYVTSLIVRSRRRRIQQTFTLTSAWDSSIEDSVLSNYDKYTKKMINGVVNASFSDSALPVGRRYLIPTVNQTDPVSGATVARQPKILPELFDDDHTITGVSQKARPFVVVKFPSDSNYYPVFKGFSIQDGRYLVFSRPITRQSVSASLIGAVLPEAVYLTAVYEDEARIEAQVDASGSLPGKRLRRLVDDETMRWDSYAEGTYTIAGGVVTTTGAADAVNDTVTLTERATARAKELAERRTAYQITLPFCPLYFRLGDTIALNGRVLSGLAVMRIMYGFGQAFNERFQPYTMIEVGTGR